MSAAEAIAKAEELLALNDKFEIAERLLVMNHEAEKRGMADMKKIYAEVYHAGKEN